MGVPTRGACRRPIEGRVVNAMGKQWHVEHFVCAKCEKPFLGHRHYERKGLAYCETHYNQKLTSPVSIELISRHSPAVSLYGLLYRAMDLHRDGVGIEKQVLYSCLLCTLPQRMAAMRDVFLVSYLQRWAGPLAILTSPSVPAEET
ncbi:uncharacterized protein LOC121107353 [Gallus gallus]|uniref:uncharacterized protein LOC121107353 n=1 Tax=Gallus gallus TaxID=9031 RepID=UPI001AEA4F53|nr:uncharacterized protein LOC121107353 [Gallus gallus]